MVFEGVHMNFQMVYGSVDMMSRMLYDFVEMNRKRGRESRFCLEYLNVKNENENENTENLSK